MMKYNEKNFKENRPTADVLMSSMRSMGYTFEAAIADIIDNSISVQATQIEVKFPIDPTDIFIAVCDNGTGMTKDELFDAMKYCHPTLPIAVKKGSCEKGKTSIRSRKQNKGSEQDHSKPL